MCGKPTLVNIQYLHSQMRPINIIKSMLINVKLYMLSPFLQHYDDANVIKYESVVIHPHRGLTSRRSSDSFLSIWLFPVNIQEYVPHSYTLSNALYKQKLGQGVKQTVAKYHSDPPPGY